MGIEIEVVPDSVRAAAAACADKRFAPTAAFTRAYDSPSTTLRASSSVSR